MTSVIFFPSHFQLFKNHPNSSFVSFLYIGIVHVYIYKAFYIGFMIDIKPNRIKDDGPNSISRTSAQKSAHML